jgi:hypothetical protein
VACTPQRRPAGGCADVARLRLLPPPQHQRQGGSPAAHNSTACQIAKLTGLAPKAAHKPAHRTASYA